MPRLIIYFNLLLVYIFQDLLSSSHVLQAPPLTQISLHALEA